MPSIKALTTNSLTTTTNNSCLFISARISQRFIQKIISKARLLILHILCIKANEKKYKLDKLPDSTWKLHKIERMKTDLRLKENDAIIYTFITRDAAVVKFRVNTNTNFKDDRLVDG